MEKRKKGIVYDRQTDRHRKKRNVNSYGTNKQTGANNKAIPIKRLRKKERIFLSPLNAKLRGETEREKGRKMLINS